MVPLAYIMTALGDSIGHWPAVHTAPYYLSSLGYHTKDARKLLQIVKNALSEQ